MENENRKIGIPESVIINGVAYTVKDTPELQQFVQEVAKVEKSKLYTQFENLKSQIANLGKVKVTGNLDADTIVEKLGETFVTKKDFKEMLPEVLKEVVQPVLTATEQNQKNELDKYREKIINENLATCIPDLVRGNTKEELDASLEESIKLRAKYPSPVRNDTKLVETTASGISSKKQAPEVSTPQNVTTTTPVQTPPAAPRRPSLEVSGPQNVKQMPMSEFEKQRETLKQQLEAMYGESSL